MHRSGLIHLAYKTQAQLNSTNYYDEDNAGTLPTVNYTQLIF